MIAEGDATQARAAARLFTVGGVSITDGRARRTAAQ